MIETMIYCSVHPTTIKKWISCPSIPLQDYTSKAKHEKLTLMYLSKDIRIETSALVKATEYAFLLLNDIAIIELSFVTAPTSSMMYK